MAENNNSTKKRKVVDIDENIKILQEKINRLKDRKKNQSKKNIDRMGTLLAQAIGKNDQLLAELLELLEKYKENEIIETIKSILDIE
ncbi:hypothetical protein [Campylobacter showae]|jgi:hypothetical protein|uniref:hypothetical protein n=1 Tax=Campylobacter showae TaxID=204 RepID=UPI000F09027D|nr:hypothetical protein [Campylobacter showae]